MTVIRKLNIFDKSKIKELRSFLNYEDENLFIDILTNGIPGHLHYYLPLKYKFLNESFLLEDKKRILGLITANTFSGNYRKINISQLLFIENAYEVAQQLVEFVLSQYGAMGADTFFVMVDDVYTELAQMFVNKCSFRQCSSEQIWESTKLSFKKDKNLKYRRFRKSDVKEVADIYNDSVLTHFKPTLLRMESEFWESDFSGLKYANEYRYVIEESGTSRIIAYFKIMTADNEKYVVDFNYSNGYDIDFDSILSSATREILKRTKKFKLYLKTKSYTNTSGAQVEYLLSNGFKCISTKNIFVKDYFRVVKEYSPEERFAVLGGLHNSPSF